MGDAAAGLRFAEGSDMATTAEPHQPARPDTGPRRVVVVGGGLAGLTAAIHAARGGASVTLLDARRQLGGRARTQEVGSPGAGTALFNEGPHALYRGLVGTEVLAELGVRPEGGKPPTPMWAADGGGISLVPTTAGDVLRRLDTFRADVSRVDMARAGISRVDMARVGVLVAVPGRRPAGPEQSMATWIEQATGRVGARRALRMLTRVATYCHDLERISADAAVIQLRSAATHGVLYIDGGWGPMVEALTGRALDHGVDIRPCAKAGAVEAGPLEAKRAEPRSAIRVVGDETITADAVVIAGAGPGEVARLLGQASPLAQGWAAEAEPVLASTLDLHLDRLPRPDRRLVFGLEEPLYFSVHTPSARLCDRGEVVHLMRNGPWSPSARREMERLCDLAQPGWRAHVLAERFGHSRVVAHDRPRPGAGAAGRPGVAVADAPGVFVAGDWVGPEGLLADAALASGRAAGRLAAAGVGPRAEVDVEGVPA
jgi:phytoene dehydrogenase-like protein